MDNLQIHRGKQSTQKRFLEHHMNLLIPLFLSRGKRFQKERIKCEIPLPLKSSMSCYCFSGSWLYSTLGRFSEIFPNLISIKVELNEKHLLRNGLAGKKLQKLLGFEDEFSFSYHSLITSKRQFYCTKITILKT